MVLPEDLQQILIPKPPKGKEVLGEVIIDMLRNAEVITNDAMSLEKQYKQKFESGVISLLKGVGYT